MSKNNKSPQFDKMVQTIMDAPITQEGVNIVCKTHGKMMGVCNTDEKFLQRFIELWPRSGERNAFSQKVMGSWLTKGIMDIPLTVEGCKGTSYSPKDGAKQVLEIWQNMCERELFHSPQGLERWYLIAKKVEAAVIMAIPEDGLVATKDGWDLELERAERIRREND
jgi:hypothetical protein